MYSPEQRLKAIELYIKYGFYAVAVIIELGYPHVACCTKSARRCNGIKSIMQAF